MKKKMVIKVSSMVNQKARNKALQLVAGFRGVESAAIKGNDGNEIEVVGDEVDAVKLTTLVRKKFAKPFCWLRYKMGYAELVAVSAVEDNKEENKGVAAEPAGQTQALAWSYGGSTPHYVWEIHDHYPSFCSIL